MSESPDALLCEIAEYVADRPVESDAAFDSAALSLADSLGCAMLALEFAECRRRLGPVVDGAVLPGGCHVRAPRSSWTRCRVPSTSGP